MRFGALKMLAIAAAAMQLSSCFPPRIKIGQEYLPVAKRYYDMCDRSADCSAAADALPLDQLYAVDLYGRSFHPWRSATNHIARRGAAAVPFLREKLGALRLAASRNVFEILSIFDIFTAMQDSKSFDVRSDPSLVTLIQDAAHAGDAGRGFLLRDQADELETGERRPFSASVVGRKWLHPPRQGL